jgi:hypothetical protein
VYGEPGLRKQEAQAGDDAANAKGKEGLHIAIGLVVSHGGD